MTKLYLSLLLIFLSSCNFTSGLHQDILKAQEYIEDQEFQLAAEIYNSILRKKPSRIIQLKVNYQLGVIYSLYLQEPNKAIYHFNQTIKFTDDPRWHIKSLEKMIEISLDQKRDYKEALTYLEKLIDFKPQIQNQEEYRFKRAECLYHIRELDKANQYFKNFLGKNNQYAVKAYYYLGLISFLERRWGDAIETWHEYIKRETKKSKNIEVKFLLANAYEMDEKLKEAYNIYYSLLGSYPNKKVIQSRLNSLYSRRVARKR
jgi:tetratricopeptide (TPR) repeat protein